MRVTMIGHSTLLIEAGQERIVTDPFFTSAPRSVTVRTSPPSMTGEEAAATATLVLVSHNHPDHCDPSFFAALDPSVPVVIPKGMEWPAGMEAPGNVVELEEWETQQIGTVTVSATPAEHVPVCCGFVIKAEKRRLYFAGDTKAAAFMRQIATELPVEIAVLPIRCARLGPGITAGTIVETVEMLDVDRVIAMHLHVRAKGGPLANIKHPASRVGDTVREWKPGVRFNAPKAGTVIDLG